MNIAEYRKLKRAKKPKFLRQDAHKKKRLEAKWQNPRGHHSKIRWGNKGHRVEPRPGYGSPKEFKFMHLSGLNMIIVHNVSEISKLNPKKDSAIIAASVGMRKKAEMVKAADEKKIKIVNIKADFLKKVEEKFAKKEKKTEKKEEKTIETIAEK
jgi:large subunit ribosomal protein L32e